MGYTYIADVDAGRLVTVNPVALAGPDLVHPILKAAYLEIELHVFDVIFRTGPEDATEKPPVVGNLCFARIEIRVARDEAGGGAAQEASEDEFFVANHAGGCCVVLLTFGLDIKSNRVVEVFTDFVE